MSIYQRKGSSKWLLDVTGLDGRRVRRSSGTANRSKALLRHAELQLELDRGKVFDTRPSQSISFGEFAERFLAYQLRLHPRSYRTYYKAQMENFAGWVGADRPLESVTLADLQEYQAHRCTLNERSSVNRSFQVLKTAFRLAVEWQLIESSPATSIRKFREHGGRRVFLELPAQAHLMSHCAEPFRTLVLVALRTGMRRGELLSLRGRDVDLARSHVTLIETKTDTPRHLPLLPEIREVLAKLAGGQPDDAKLFRTRDGKPYTAAGAESNFRRARIRAGLEHVHFHDLRHTFASDCLAAGIHLSVIRQWLGHRLQSTTDRYLHLSDRQARESLGTLEAYLAAHRIE